MPKFNEMDRVILKANEEEGWPEEHGIVVAGPSKKKIYIVRVDDQYLQDKGDDGLREIEEGGLEREK